MPTHKNASIRYQALDKCFRDYRHRYFIEDLIEKCNEALESFNFSADISRRTIFDDIRFMESEAGWAIPLDRIHDGKRVYYRYSDHEFSINKQPLTDTEAEQLKTAILTLGRFRGLPCNEWIEDVISNLEYRFNLHNGSQNLVEFEQNANLKGLQYLSPAIDAASAQQVLHIVYRNYKNGGRDLDFILHPYFIKQYNNRWFLLGLEHGKERIANIALDRICHMEPDNAMTFIPNKDINFEHYFDNVVGVTIPKDGTAIEICLKFSIDRFKYAVSKPLHHSQRIIDEKEHILSIIVIPNRELDQLIFSFGPDVEVLSPDSYRQHIKDKIEENMKIYFPVQKDCTQRPYICSEISQERSKSHEC